MAGCGRTSAAALFVCLTLCGTTLAAHGSPDKDREVLVRFRDSISNWEAVKKTGNLEGWDDSKPTYLWTGVVLDFSLRVRELTLVCFNFMTCIPAEISTQSAAFAELAQLEHLELLDFTGNNITGELPDSWAVPGTFPALRTLSISAAQLNGSLPAAWGSPGAFPALGELRLNGNRLRGSLPTSWGARGAFPALKELALNDNAFSGTLPLNWGQGPSFPNLEVLALTASGASGTLPPGWGADGGFTSLHTLSLAGSGLSGGLPLQWAAPGRFPKLDTLDLQENQLSGSLPQDWACKLCLPELSKLHLQNNSISGSLPDTWAAMGRLRELDVSGNRLQGQLPASWGAAGMLPQLAMLLVANNSLGGSLPESWGNPRALPALNWLLVSHNAITGSLPAAWGVPNSFPRLRLLHLDHNQLNGSLPVHWTLNSTMQQLFTFSLAHNALTGTLPDFWGALDNSLSSLYTLDLGFNSLTGSLPPHWGTSRSSLASLTSLSIAGNNFTGPVPPAWGLLRDVHYLVLAPGNPTVCRPLPYVGQFVTCYGEDGTTCQEPVQLRSNCSSDQPGWAPYRPPPAAGSGLTSLHVALAAAGASLVAACGMLATVLVLRWREERHWQAVKGRDMELALRDGADPLADLLAAAAERKRGRGQHSALAQKLLKECAVDQSDLMFCRGSDGNLVQLGAGAYGQVYKAFLYGVHPVAVKVFHTQDDVPTDDFWREISILRTCRHSNIVQFQGACVDGDTTMMVTELLDTDLYRALQAKRVSWYRHGLDIALDVAQALHFLHSRNIIHFDCKSPNILLSTTNSAKLADVGWAQILYHSYITGDGGTFNWAAPEQLIGLKCTAKADVYSYGLVLWELCTRELPVRGQIRDIRVPAEAPQLVVDLVRSCLDVDPARRPCMADIIGLLQAEKERSAKCAGTSSSAASASAPSSSSPYPGSSLGLRGLDLLPGTSMHTSSGSGSAFDASTSSRGAGRSGGGSGGGGGGTPSVHSGGDSRSGHSSPLGAGTASQSRPTSQPTSAADSGRVPAPTAAAAAAAGATAPHIAAALGAARAALAAAHGDGSSRDASLGSDSQPSPASLGLGGSKPAAAVRGRAAGAYGGVYAAGSSSAGGGSRDSGSGSGSGRAASPHFKRSSGGGIGSHASGGGGGGASIFDGSAWAAGRLGASGAAGAAAGAGAGAAGFTARQQGPMPFSPAGPAASSPLPPAAAAAATPAAAPHASLVAVPSQPAEPPGPSISAHLPWFAANPFAVASAAAAAAAAAAASSTSASTAADSIAAAGGEDVEHSCDGSSSASQHIEALQPDSTPEN
ncbi:hypothetical protein D9Q98_003819 [Chlorella vulgaris]|uniref:Protein kinase domain-containing protein n=1 Tax=Chlorella vulgaris TaxID=3077 RepID=A0A9D4TQY7_CHLVU|nr:hypothetical protein D9Q98_003819 [Chlorella vulgaris]